MKPYFVKRLPKPVPEEYNNPHVDYWDGQDSTALYICSRDIKPMLQDMWNNTDSKSDKEPYTIVGELSPGAVWVKEGDEFDENEIEFRKYSFCFSKPQPDTHFNNPIRYPYYMSHTLVSEGRDEHSRSYSYIIITGECIKIKGTCGHFH